MAEYRISFKARADLINIYTFSATTFGDYQAEAYLAGLERIFGLLAEFPRIGMDAAEWPHAIGVFASSRTTSFTRKNLDSC